MGIWDRLPTILQRVVVISRTNPSEWSEDLITGLPATTFLAAVFENVTVSRLLKKFPPTIKPKVHYRVRNTCHWSEWNFKCIFKLSRARYMSSNLTSLLLSLRRTLLHSLYCFKWTSRYRLTAFYVADRRDRGVWGEGLRPIACWDCGFESRQVHGCLFLRSVVCFQVQVSEKGRSLVQRSSTDCVVACHCVWSRNLKNKASLIGVGWVGGGGDLNFQSCPISILLTVSSSHNPLFHRPAYYHHYS
jgi:hypothetical protein